MHRVLLSATRYATGVFLLLALAPGSSEAARNGPLLFEAEALEQYTDLNGENLRTVGTGSFAVGPGDRGIRRLDSRRRRGQFSLDGRRIAYIGGREADVFIMPASGAGVTTRVTRGANAVAVSWAPDGVHLVYAADREDRANGPIITVEARPRGRQQRVGWGYEPSWSPAGRILFTRYMGPGHANPAVFLMRADGSDARHVAEELWYSAAPWSPNGRRFVARVFRDDRYGVAVVDVKSGRVRTIGDFDGHEPIWSPDGRRIAFIAGDAVTPWTISTIKPDGRGRRELVNAGSDFPRYFPSSSDHFILSDLRWQPRR